MRRVPDEAAKTPPGARPIGRFAGVQLFATPAAPRLVVFCLMSSWVFLFSTGDAQVPAVEKLSFALGVSGPAKILAAAALLALPVVPALLATSFRRSLLVVSVTILVGVFGVDDVGSFSAGLLRSFMVAAATLLSLLVHEFAHVLVGRRSGVPSSGVVVTGFGAGAVFTADEFPTARAMFLTTAAGPVSSALFALCSALPVWLLLGTVPEWWMLVSWVSLLVAAVNAIPVLPLDGGWMAAAGVWKFRRTSHKRAEAAYRKVGPWLLGTMTVAAAFFGFSRQSELAVSVFWTLVTLIPLLFVTQHRVRALGAKNRQELPLPASADA